MGELGGMTPDYPRRQSRDSLMGRTPGETRRKRFKSAISTSYRSASASGLSPGSVMGLRVPLPK